MKSPTAYLSLAILVSASCDGFDRESHRIRGHMAALFTPFHPDGSLDLGEVLILLPKRQDFCAKMIRKLLIFAKTFQAHFLQWRRASKSGASATSW